MKGCLVTRNWERGVQVYTNNAYAMDGCATFFKRAKFSLVKKYEVRRPSYTIPDSSAVTKSSSIRALTMMRTPAGQTCPNGQSRRRRSDWRSSKHCAVDRRRGVSSCHDRVVWGRQVEFNKAALSLSDSIAPEQKKTALNRLLKVWLASCSSRAQA